MALICRKILCHKTYQLGTDRALTLIIFCFLMRRQIGIYTIFCECQSCQGRVTFERELNGHMSAA